jgi:hypothetical protein
MASDGRLPHGGDRFVVSGVRVDGSRPGLRPLRRPVHARPSRSPPPRHKRSGRDFYSLASTITDRALEFLDGAQSERQFLWIHYFDPHDPCSDAVAAETLGPQEILAQARERDSDVDEMLSRARELYAADCEYLDAQLDRLLQRLQRDEDRIATHVMITADHGESFGEDGSVGHGSRLTPAQIHVPTLIRSPLVAPGVRTDVAGSHDLAATLLALAGVEEHTFHGRDLTKAPRAPGRASGARRYSRGALRTGRIDGREDDWEGVLFYVVDADGALHRGNSSRLMAVPGEAPPAQERASELTRLFTQFERQLARRGGDPPLDPELEAAPSSSGTSSCCSGRRSWCRWRLSRSGSGS